MDAAPQATRVRRTGSLAAGCLETLVREKSATRSEERREASVLADGFEHAETRRHPRGRPGLGGRTVSLRWDEPGRPRREACRARSMRVPFADGASIWEGKVNSTLSPRPSYFPECDRNSKSGLDGRLCLWGPPPPQGPELGDKLPWALRMLMTRTSLWHVHLGSAFIVLKIHPRGKRTGGCFTLGTQG